MIFFLVLGLDIVTPESLYGYESESYAPSNDPTYTTERIILPDTSQFFQGNMQKLNGPSVAFPKYNNYLLDKSKFDQYTRVFIPLKLLGIKPLEHGELLTKNSLPEIGAVVSYAQYKQASYLFPEKYDDSVVRRWGVDITLGSPLISVGVLVPEYVDAVSKTTTMRNIIFEDVKLPEIDISQQDMFLKKSIHNHDSSYENNPQYLQTNKRRLKRDQSTTKRLLYKSLSGITLKTPIKLQIWLDSNKTLFNERSNPQCVHWSPVRG